MEVGSSSDSDGRTIDSYKKSEQPINVIYIQNAKLSTSNDKIKWQNDQITNHWGLNFINSIGIFEEAKDGFYDIVSIRVMPKNMNVQIPTVSSYYFNGKNMYIGWLKTIDNNWYFFENLKTIDEGKMAIGWKVINGVWYYFGIDGKMLYDIITPDGYRLDKDGRWIP